jgi:hypothetical protein
MANTQGVAAKVKDAHYHPVVTSAKFAAYSAAVSELATNTVAERERRRAQLRRETTYARGTLGET